MTAGIGTGDIGSLDDEGNLYFRERDQTHDHLRRREHIPG